MDDAIGPIYLPHDRASSLTSSLAGITWTHSLYNFRCNLQAQPRVRQGSRVKASWPRSHTDPSGLSSRDGFTGCSEFPSDDMSATDRKVGSTYGSKSA
jgi:hypothetical protein